MMKKQLFYLLIGLAVPFFSRAQETDTIPQLAFWDDLVPLNQQSAYLARQPYLKKAIIPFLLMTYGGLSVGNPYVKSINTDWRNTIMRMDLGRTKTDDYTQFAPVAMVHGLNFAGIKGNNSIGNLTIVSLTSFMVSTAIVRPLKKFTAERRPNGANYQSFPSGHTSTAFVSAQVMFREFKDKNLLLSLAGYPLAAYTAICRTVNDKHWIGDIVAGAGIGILSTELSYYLLPAIKKFVSRLSMPNALEAYPLYQNNAYGVGFRLKI